MGTDETDRPQHATTTEPVVLGLPTEDRAFLFGVFPVLGAVAGAFAPALARWVLTLDLPLPFRFLIEVTGDLDQWWGVALSAGAGALLGAWVGVIGWWEAVVVTVREDRVVLRTKGKDRTVV